ncbi:MarR family winged helix-turn-helix transcriptional regulator [Alkaliphilus crotonatoxidans]
MDLLTKYISRTARCATLYRSSQLEQYGLNGCQHSYILNICKNPGISQDQLAKIIYVNKSSVARQLALLEQGGFITRTPHEADRRQMQVFPTDKALNVYPRLMEILENWNQLLLSDFSPEEQRNLYAMMERVMERAISLVTEGTAGDKE